MKKNKNFQKKIKIKKTLKPVANKKRMLRVAPRLEYRRPGSKK